MYIGHKQDDGRQHRSQTKDFGEISSMHSTMNVSEEKWDRIFHNWDNPEDCKQGKKNLCSICNRIKKGEVVTRITPTPFDEKKKESGNE
jgi:hypothetical protein